MKSGSLKEQVMVFKGMEAQIRTAVVQNLFYLNRALLISSFNLATALAVFLLEVLLENREGAYRIE